MLLCNPGSISSPQWRGYQSRCCPHRWPHSQVTDPQWSPDSTQALLYSPMRSRATHPPAMNSPVMCTTPTHQKIYTPVIPHELKMASSSRAPYGTHGIGILRDRLNLMKTSSCVHKTQSKASLISSESDLSLECSSQHLVSEVETPQIDESYFCAFNTSASAGSDARKNNVVVSLCLNVFSAIFTRANKIFGHPGASRKKRICSSRKQTLSFLKSSHWKGC